MVVVKNVLIVLGEMVYIVGDRVELGQWDMFIYLIKLIYNLFIVDWRGIVYFFVS